MDYTLSEPTPLPKDQALREKALVKYAPLIARSYGHNFDPKNPQKQISDAAEGASHIVVAHDGGGEPVGILTYRIRSPQSPASAEFYGNLGLEKLPAHLYPDFLQEENREHIERYIQERRGGWYGIEFLEKAVAPEFGLNGLGGRLAEAAISPYKNENLFIVGNAQPAASVLSREKIFAGDSSRSRATIWGGEIMRPDLNPPGGLTPLELKVLALVLAHSFVKAHYPEALNIAAGENFDINALLSTRSWSKHLKPSNLNFASNNLAVPQAQKVEEKIIKRQQETGQPISGIVTTILDKPNFALQKAA